jgi:hypothetical protein
MTGINKTKLFFSVLFGFHGFDSFVALTHQIGKALLPFVLKAAAVFAAFDAIINENGWTFAGAFFTWLAASLLERHFDAQCNELIRLPIDEVLTQFRKSGATQLIFIHCALSRRIKVLFNGRRVFDLGSDSEHLVGDYLLYILSDEFKQRYNELSAFPPAQEVSDQSGNTLTELRFERAISRF